MLPAWIKAKKYIYVPLCHITFFCINLQYDIHIYDACGFNNSSLEETLIFCNCFKSRISNFFTSETCQFRFCSHEINSTNSTNNKIFFFKTFFHIKCI